MDDDDKKQQEEYLNIEESDNETEKNKIFCFMMVNFIPNQKINTFIAETPNPFEAVNLHNKGQAKSSKSTRSAKPNWKLNMIIGPFNNNTDKASKFASKWRSRSRGIISRRTRGKYLAKKQNLICWDTEVKQQIQIQIQKNFDDNNNNNNNKKTIVK